MLNQNYEDYERRPPKYESENLKVRKLNANLLNLKKICNDFENYNMIGSAVERLSSDFRTHIKSYEDTLNDYKKYLEIIELYEELLEVENKITKTEGSINYQQSKNPKTEEEEKQIDGLIREKNQLVIEKQLLREKILKLLSELGIEIPPEMEIVTTRTWDDIVELVNAFSSLKKTGNVFVKLVEKGIYASEEEAIEAFKNKFSNLRNQYDGKEKTYYSAMEIIEMCMAAGTRIPYVHAGTNASGRTEDTRIPVPVETLKRGIDCNALASLLLYSDDSYSSWMTVSQFRAAGEEVEKAESLPGDFFVTKGHVGLVVANNPETKEMAILHASGEIGDLKFEIVTYDGYLEGKEIRRIDSEYNTPYMQEKYDKEFGVNNDEIS